MRPSNSSPDNLIGLYYLKKLLINKKLSIKDNNKIILIIFLLSLVTNESEQ